jgi:hypothetical protein
LLYLKALLLSHVHVSLLLVVHVLLLLVVHAAAHQLVLLQAA